MTGLDHSLIYEVQKFLIKSKLGEHDRRSIGTS
jgi:hypothetical protein